MSVLPGSLGLTVIADGSLAVAADVRNNYTAIQTAVNALIAILANGNGVDGDPLVWDNTNAKWAAASTLASTRPRAPRVVTSAMAGGPPASPVDLDVWIATAVDGNGTRWAFQYNAGSASASKWEFIGGPPALASNINQDGGNFAGAWGDTGSVVGVTVARAGDYACSAAAIGVNGAGADVLGIGIAPGAVNPTWFSAVSLAAGGQGALAVVDAPLLAVAAATLIKIRYLGGAQVDNWKSRSLSVLPIRVA
jgi:hypothetical protein